MLIWFYQALSLIRSFEWVRYFENDIRIKLNRNATPVDDLKHQISPVRNAVCQIKGRPEKGIVKSWPGKYKKVIPLRCPAFPCFLLTFVWEEKKGERRSLLNNVILGSTMLSTGDSRSYTSSCSGKIWEWVREIHLLRLPDLPLEKMSVRRHFAPNFRLWTSIQLCKNQTSNGKRATMSCIFCEEVPGLTFPGQTPCCIIHVLLVISATSISFLLLLYLCISS